MALFYVNDYPDWIDKLMNDVYALFEDESGIYFDENVWSYIRESKEPPHIGNASVSVMHNDLVRIMTRYFREEIGDAFIAESIFESEFNYEANAMGSHYYFNNEEFTEFDELKDMIEEWIKENDDGYS